ncbi:MAG: tryptophan synthase subunit alpha [Campylobacterota bacterium]|nr:tryptophan synthase subunit alpha [Campylobacterota bacterium]
MEKKLVGFITSSLPENNFTADLAFSMKEAGLDTLELGIPFSDPVADGPIIEKASLLALQNNFKLTDLFEVTSKIAPKIDTLWMGYMNPYFHYGMEEFLKKGEEYNISGSIIPDLPYEEARKYKDLFQNYNQSLIDFVAPTDSVQRIEKITKNSSKFIYMVAYAGITGSNTNEDLSKIIQNVRKNTNTPLYIGFGVDEKTAKNKAKDVDGVIVGSAFVKHLIDDSLNYNEKMRNITQITKNIKDIINS